MLCESSQGSEASENQMSELLRCRGARNKDPLLPPSNGSKPRKGCPGAGAGRSLEGGPGAQTRIRQAWDGVELTEIRVSAQGLTTGPPRGGLPHWCVPRPGAVWEAGGETAAEAQETDDPQVCPPAMGAFDFLCEACFHRTERGHFSSRATSLSLKRLWGLSVLRDTGW